MRKQRCASRLVVPVYAGLTLHAGGDTPLVSVRSRPLGQVPSPSSSASALIDYHYPIRKKVVGILNRATSQYVGGVQRHIHPATLPLSCLPRKPQAALEHLPRLFGQYQACAKQLKRTLREGPSLDLYTQCHLPAYVEVRFLLGFGVARIVVGLQQKRGRHQARRNAVPPVVGAVQLPKLLVTKQLSTQRGQQAAKLPRPTWSMYRLSASQSPLWTDCFPSMPPPVPHH